MRVKLKVDLQDGVAPVELVMWRLLPLRNKKTSRAYKRRTERKKCN